MTLIKLDGSNGYLTLGPGMKLLVEQSVTAGEARQWQVRVRQVSPHPEMMATVWTVSGHASRKSAETALDGLVIRLGGAVNGDWPGAPE